MRQVAPRNLSPCSVHPLEVYWAVWALPCNCSFTRNDDKFVCWMEKGNLTKCLVLSGVCGRHGAKKLVAAGGVLLDGERATFSSIYDPLAPHPQNLQLVLPPGFITTQNISEKKEENVEEKHGAVRGREGADLDRMRHYLPSIDELRSRFEISRSEDGSSIVHLASPSRPLSLLSSSTSPSSSLVPQRKRTRGSRSEAPSSTAPKQRKHEIAEDVDTNEASNDANSDNSLDDGDNNNNFNNIYILYHKPRGVTCTTDTRIPESWLNRIPDLPTKRLTSVGRLDKESEGLLLLTNDGSIVNPLMKSEHLHEKEYHVTVNKPLIIVKPEKESEKEKDKEKEKNEEKEGDGRDEGQRLSLVDRLREGVKICKGKVETLPPVLVEPLPEVDSRSFRIVLREGKNRQIRKMAFACGYNVRRLVRVRIGRLELGGLRPGEWRKLEEGEEEMKWLQEVKRNSGGSGGGEEEEMEKVNVKG